MTTFESILLLATTACVIITAFGILVIKQILKEIIDRKYADWEQLRKIETHLNGMVNIETDVEIISNNFLHLIDESVGIPALVDIVDKIHRNLCAKIADASVEELKRDDVYMESRRLAAINTAAVCENMTKIRKELQKKGGEQ